MSSALPREELFADIEKQTSIRGIFVPSTRIFRVSSYNHPVSFPSVPFRSGAVRDSRDIDTPVRDLRSSFLFRETITARYGGSSKRARIGGYRAIPRG